MALVTPSKEHPIPYDLTDETPTTLLDELTVAGNTAEVQVALGATLELTAKDVEL